MSRRGKDLPPLGGLAVFEAAARHLSFQEAARDFNVTPGAVSRQIKALETELGCALFLRVHRGVRLTPEGEALSIAVGEGFAQIAKACRRASRLAKASPRSPRPAAACASGNNARASRLARPPPLPRSG